MRRVWASLLILPVLLCGCSHGKHRAAPASPVATVSAPTETTPTELAPTSSPSEVMPPCGSRQWWIQQDGDHIWVLNDAHTGAAVSVTLSTTTGAVLEATDPAGGGVVFDGLFSSQIASVVMVGAAVSPCVVQWQYAGVQGATLPTS